MEPYQPSHAFQALRMLSDGAERHRDGFTKYADRADSDDSDTDNDSLGPVVDTFLENGGSKAVCDMTNFTLSEFSYLWGKKSKTMSYQLGMSAEAANLLRNRKVFYSGC